VNILKAVRGALNEKDAKLLKKEQEKLNMTEHGVITKLAKGVAHRNKLIIQFLQDTKASTLTVIYLAFCYSMIAATAILI